MRSPPARCLYIVTRILVPQEANTPDYKHYNKNKASHHHILISGVDIEFRGYRKK